MHPRTLAVLALAIGACAPTTLSSPPPVEVLVVLSGGQNRELRVIPTDHPDSITRISLGPGAGRPSTMALSGSIAAVGLAEADQVYLINLITRSIRTISLGAGAPLGSLTAGPNGSFYATTAETGRVTVISGDNGAISPIQVNGGPRSVAISRGKSFALMGSRHDCTPAAASCPQEVSWLQSLTGTDSIPMVGGGNPMGSVILPDGTIFVLNRGGGETNGNLSGINPVSGREFFSLLGFGRNPLYLGFDGVDRIYVASISEGLMVFNARTRVVERGPGEGIPLPRIPRAVTTDGISRVYVVEAEGCGGTTTGVIRVFGRDLIERRVIPVGDCPVAAGITELPGNPPSD